MNLQSQKDRFTIPGVVAFDETEHGLIRIRVTSKLCTAEIYLQGAHLAQWHPVGHEPVLFLSDRSFFQAGKAIRGGIPIIFPWFGARTANQLSSRTDGPAHGFARTSVWQLTDATVTGDNVHITLILEPTETSRSFGFDNFKVTYKISLGSKLDLQLIVENKAAEPMAFEEALHSYFVVGDAEKISISGLADTDFIDKTDGFERKHQEQSVLILTGETDRPYLNSEASITLEDPVLKRQIKVVKENSMTTVVWNPWSELTAKMADMSPDGWKRFTCIETANAAENLVTLAPHEKHVMTAHVVIEQLASS